MNFPLSFLDMSLWLAVTAVILLATVELLSPPFRKTSILIEEGRLRAVALIVGLLFMFSLFVRIYQIMTSQ